MAARSRRRIQKNIVSMIREQDVRRRLVHVVIPVALVFMVAAYWAMHVNAITMASGDPVCGIEEHTHTEDCYSWIAVVDSTEAVESVYGTEDTEATEVAEATEIIEATEEIESTELAGNTELTEALEGTEAIEATEATTASTDSSPEEGDTKVIDGVTYTYTLICTLPEHTHTDSCYEDTSTTVVTYSSVDDSEEEQSGESESTTESETASGNDMIMLMNIGEEETSTATTSSTSEGDSSTISINSASEDNSSTTTTSSTSEGVTYSAANCTYDSDTGDFSVDLSLEFTFLKDNSSSDYKYDYAEKKDGVEIGDEYKTYVYIIDLPEGIIVPSSMIGTDCVYNGYATGTTSKKFEYYFIDDGDGDGPYSVVLAFSKDYIDDEVTDDTFSGSVTLSGYISNKSYSDDGKGISITYGMSEELTLTISSSDITWSDDATVNEDISVKKSGSYNASAGTAGTITYTVTVFSKKGTGDTITLTDYFTDTNFSSILGDLKSVTYQAATTVVDTWTGSSGTYAWDRGTTLDDGTSAITISEGSEGDGAFCYYYDSDGKLVIVLNGLAEGSSTESTDSDGTTVTTQADSWVVTYTYEVNPESNVVYYSTNCVTAATYDKYAEVEISAQANAQVSVSGTTMIAKSGSYSSSDGEITWKIVVGNGDTDLDDYLLTDDMLAEMKSGSLTITNASGTELTDTNGSESGTVLLYATRTSTESTDGDENEVTTYTYTYYSDSALKNEVTFSDSELDSTSGLPGDTTTYPVVVLCEKDAETGEVTVAGIVFNSGTQYTITYTTELASAWSSQYVTNEAVMSYEGTDEDKSGSSYEGTGSVWINGEGSSAFSKSYVKAAEDASDSSLYTLTWTSSYTVPAMGIPANTTFRDYVTSYTGSGVHYITAAQAGDIADALKTEWGESNITNIQFCTNSNAWSYSDSDWVDADSVSEDDVYYQFRFTTVYEVEYYDSSVTSEASDGYITKTVTENGTEVTKLYYSSNAITYTYDTTAKISDSNSNIYDSNIYYNSLTDGSTTKSDSWSWYDKVVKYGADTSGNINGTDNTSVTVSDDDGTVTWIVRVMMDENASTYTITDTLPEGVTLSELYVSRYGSNYGYEQVDLSDSSGTAVSTTLSNVGKFSCIWSQDTKNTDDDSSDDVCTVTLTASNVSDGVSMLYIKYVCSVKNAAANSTNYTSEDETTVESYVYNLTNNVRVATDVTDSYGSDDENVTVTWKQTTEETEVLTKNEEFDKNNNVLTYSVVINPEHASYTYTTSDGEIEEYDDLTVTDVLTYSSFPMNGLAREASLVTSSVKLYYATVSIDDSGNTTVTKGEELSSSDYSWTFNEETLTESWREYITKTLELTVPNGVTLVLEYQYLVTIVSDEGGWTDTSAGVTNYATLSAEATELYTTTPIASSAQVSDIQTSASVNASTGYTIYKVDEDNFSITLSGAVYTLYVYNSSAGKFSKTSTFTTGSNGTVTISGTLVTDSSSNDPSYYVVTMSDGTTADIPVDTICYVRETTAPEDYKVDGVNYYFYFGSSIATLASSCSGYSDGMENVKNLIVSYTNYVTNAHSSDYYAAKTSISVVKRWVDADGEEYTKTDGSLSFNLYRVLILNDGTITSAAEQEGTASSEDDGEDDSGSTSSDGKVSLKWYLEDNQYFWRNSYIDSGSMSITAGTKVTFSIYSSAITVAQYYKYYSGLTITDGTNTLFSMDYEGNTTINTGNFEISLPGIGEQTYTITYTAQDDVALYFSIDENSSKYIITQTAATESSGSSGDGESSGNDGDDADDNGGSEETVETGTAYRANFSELYHPLSTYFTISDNGSSTDYSLNGEAVGWTDEDTSHTETGFFTVTGNLNAGHTTVSWDVNEDGVVNSDELALDVCLKMETDINSKDENGDDPTTVQFTTKEGGYLTLVFNSDYTGNVTITDGENSTDYYATNNRIYVYLKSGTYTITRLSYCFLYYMQFNEGAEEVETESDYYIHNFNNGIDSDFYSISGSLSHSYGTLVYNDVSVSQCLKMNSTAQISFTTGETGTLYLYLTNPKGSKKVGIILDGQEIIATGTTTADSKGYRIYTLTIRLEAGSHTISRITSTENMLYYIEYVPDDYGGKSWDNSDDVEDEALGYLYDTDTDTANAYWSNKELVGNYSVTASDDWSWSSTKLASEYVDTETGAVLGYFVYFVVEDAVTVNGTDAFITTYLNDSGITGGSIGITNKINSASGGTSIAVQKVWEYGTSDDSVKTELETLVRTAEITYELYAKMNFYDNATETDLSAGDSEICTFSTKTGDNSFFTVGSSAGLATYGGDVTYNGTTYGSALKMDGNGTVTFEATATNGILTLVYSTYARGPGASSGGESQYGPDFSITGPDGETYNYVYVYDSDSKIGTLMVYKENAVTTDDPYNVKIESYSQSNNTAVVTLTLGNAGEYTVKRSQVTPVTNKTSQCCLYYMEYSYKYCNLVDGILTKTGTLTASDSEGTATTTWARLYKGLPINIYNDEGTEIIGTYSYYVKETGVTMTINGETQMFIYNSGDRSYTYTYTDDSTNMTYIYSVSSVLDVEELETQEATEAVTEEATETGASTSAVTIANKAITSGTLTLTNTLKLSTSADYELPETGSIGTKGIYAVAVLLIGLFGIVVIAENRRQKGSR